MVEKSAEEVPMENLTISARDYNDLVLMLEECKRYCRKLTVGLHTDPTIDRPDKNRPIEKST